MASLPPATGPEALARLLEREGDKLFALARRVTRDPDLAADAVQAAFASALEGISEFRGEAALSTWLHRIVYNKAVDLLRQRGRESHLGGDPDTLGPDDLERAHAPSWAEPERELRASRLREALDAAFDALTPLQRAVFEMREEEGKSSDEVGEALGLSPGAVRVHLHRARLRLRARLSELLGSGGV